MQTEYENALHLMEAQGGSFVKALVHCYYRADPVNKEKLRETFASYFDAYEERFQIIRRSNHGPE